MTVRILVTGSREFTDRNLVMGAMYDALRAASEGERLSARVTVVHGAARGADRLAAFVATKWGWATEAHPAEWARDSKAAGFMRNQRMVDAGADICIALLVKGLPCRGTRDCARRAERAGIPVLMFEQDGAR